MSKLRRIKQIVWILIAAAIFLGILSTQTMKSQATSRASFFQEEGQPTFYKDNGYRILYINGLNTSRRNAELELRDLVTQLSYYTFDTPGSGSKTLGALFGSVIMDGYQLIYNNNIGGSRRAAIRQYIASIALKIQDDMGVSSNDAWQKVRSIFNNDRSKDVIIAIADKLGGEQGKALKDNLDSLLSYIRSGYNEIQKC